jgi:putative membrane protein insertion efficiency factor
MKTALTYIQRFFKVTVISLIRIYKTFLSPFLPSACRFYPTCSEYAVQAIEKHGVLKGGYKSAIRILKCNPLFPGGYDPV